MTVSTETRRDVVEKINKTVDLDIHISRLTTAFGTYAEIREHIPSRNIYGRGVLIPLEVLDDVLNALEGVGPRDDDTASTE